MKKKIKKLYKGCVSVRDYIVNDCISNNESLIIEHNNQIMTLPVSKLMEKTQFSAQTFKSKFNNFEYSLYDFTWAPDEKQTRKTLF